MLYYVMCGILVLLLGWYVGSGVRTNGWFLNLVLLVIWPLALVVMLVMLCTGEIRRR